MDQQDFEKFKENIKNFCNIYKTKYEKDQKNTYKKTVLETFNNIVANTSYFKPDVEKELELIKSNPVVVDRKTYYYCNKQIVARASFLFRSTIIKKNILYSCMFNNIKFLEGTAETYKNIFLTNVIESYYEIENDGEVYDGFTKSQLNEIWDVTSPLIYDQTFYITNNNCSLNVVINPQSQFKFIQFRYGKQNKIKDFFNFESKIEKLIDKKDSPFIRYFKKTLTHLVLKCKTYEHINHKISFKFSFNLDVIDFSKPVEIEKAAEPEETINPGDKVKLFDDENSISVEKDEENDEEEIIHFDPKDEELLKSSN